VNPTALITGASRGIGRGIALALARAGYDLVLNYVANESAAQETARACIEEAQRHRQAVQALPCRADIGRAADRAALVEFTRGAFHRLDLLVNNAGVAPAKRSDLLDADETSFDRLLAVNVKGPYFLTQQVARWMISEAEAQRGNTARQSAAYRPKIVTISSISAYAPSVNRGDYCVSKAALAMLTPLYAARLAPHGIHVFELRPGIMATDMTAPVREKYDRLIAQGLTPIRRWGTPADVAQAVLAIAQDRFPFSTGEVINVDGGFHLRVL
jgi:NAD(P)-dependent dehydrogenase (short-subunit alcohol dehydrogenase family)